MIEVMVKVSLATSWRWKVSFISWSDLFQIPTEQEERSTPELGWKLQARQSLAAARNCSTIPQYTDSLVKAFHDNTVSTVNKNEHNKNVPYMLTVLRAHAAVHILSPNADTRVSSIAHSATDKQTAVQVSNSECNEQYLSLHTGNRCYKL
jgi:leucyl aminopeptidase (aminopeptidase T)